MLSGALLFPFVTLLGYVGLHTAWELWQVYIGMTPLTLRGGIDVVVDTLMGVLGYSLASKISYVSTVYSISGSATRTAPR